MILLLLANAFAEPSGTALVHPDDFIVQEKATVQWTYTVGEAGFGPGDSLVIRDPEFHGMRWSKWGAVTLTPTDADEGCTPAQGGQSASKGAISARASEPSVTVEVVRSDCNEVSRICREDIHEQAWTTLYVDGPLEPGDTITYVLGDTEQGADCGFEMPDRAFPMLYWASSECLADECQDLEPVVLHVSANPSVRHVLATAPSQVLVGEPFVLKVSLLDNWGNAVAQTASTVQVELPGAGSIDVASHDMVPSDGGWHDFLVTLDEPGVRRIEVTAGPETVASNPIEVLTEPPELYTWWGDIHVHHGYAYQDEYGEPQDANYTYARDVVGLDIVSEAAKAKGIEIEEDALWEELQDKCVSYTADDFLVMLGFEWIGQIASDELGVPTDGHRNVYYDSCDGEYGTHDTSIIAGVGDLHDWVNEVRERDGVDAVVFPHAMQRTGYNFDVVDPKLETLAEIYSEWGDNSTEIENRSLGYDGPDGTVEDMLNSSVRVGFIGGSDNHDGWMGNPYSLYSTNSGVGAFLAPRLDRASIFAAMRARRTFATTGQRALVYLEVTDDGNTALPGCEIVGKDPFIRWRVHGTAAISSATLWQVALVDGSSQEALCRDEPGELDVEGECDPEWDGQTPVAWWLEVVQEDGDKAWSSPVWVTPDCERLGEGAADPLGQCDAVDRGDLSEELRAQLALCGEAEPAVEIPRTRCTGCSTSSGGALSLLGLLVPVARRRRERR